MNFGTLVGIAFFDVMTSLTELIKSKRVLLPYSSNGREDQTTVSLWAGQLVWGAYHSQTSCLLSNANFHKRSK